MEPVSYTAIVGLLCTVVGGIIGYVAFVRNKEKDDKTQGRQDGTILTELGYIKSGVDDLKSEQREQRKVNTDFIARITAVEAGVTQAHRRIDEQQKTIYELTHAKDE